MGKTLTLRQARLMKDIPLKLVAERLSVSQATWLSYEKGNTTIPADKFMDFCDMVEVDANDIELS